MTNVFIQDTTLTAIGDAIREKTGKSDLILPSKMSEAIDNIPTNSIGKYIWCKQNIGDTVTEDNTSGSYTLTNASKSSSEIEYCSVMSDWTQSNITSDNFYCVYYDNNNGIWVSSGHNKGLYYSTDGITWTQSNITSGKFYCVYYGNGIWVAGSYSSNGLYYSTDGMTWTQSNITSGDFGYVYYDNGWVAGSGSNSSNGLYYSTDGMTWTQSNITSGYFNLNSICCNNGAWVACSYNTGIYYSMSPSAGKVLIASPGGEWVASELPPSNSGSAVQIITWEDEPSGGPM